MPATWPVALATWAWPGSHMPTCSGLALCWGSSCGGSPSPTGGLPSGPPRPCPHPCGALPARLSGLPSLPPRSPQPTGFSGSRPSTGLRPPFPVHVTISCLVVTSPTTVLPLPGPPARSPERDDRAVSRVNSPTGLAWTRAAGWPCPVNSALSSRTSGALGPGGNAPCPPAQTWQQSKGGQPRGTGAGGEPGTRLGAGVSPAAAGVPTLGPQSRCHKMSRGCRGPRCQASGRQEAASQGDPPCGRQWGGGNSSGGGRVLGEPGVHVGGGFLGRPRRLVGGRGPWEASPWSHSLSHSQLLHSRMRNWPWGL